MWWSKPEPAALVAGTPSSAPGAGTLVQRWRKRLEQPHALWWGPTGLWHADGSGEGGAARRHDSFEAWCRLHPGSRARLWLSSWWVLDLVIDPALPLSDDAALIEHARPLLRHFMGEHAQQWPLAAWHSGTRKGVSGLHGQPLQALMQVAQAHRVALLQVQPWWARALCLAACQTPALGRADSARLLVVEGTLLTDLWLRHGTVHGLQQRRLADAGGHGLAHYLDPAASSTAGRATAPHTASRAPAPHTADHAPGTPGHANTWVLGYGWRQTECAGPQPTGAASWQVLGTLAELAPAPRWWHPPAQGLQRRPAPVAATTAAPTAAPLAAPLAAPRGTAAAASAHTLAATAP